MSDDDDTFWADYLVDRHQLSSQLYTAPRGNPCPVADCKGRCDCSDELHAERGIDP